MLLVHWFKCNSFLSNYNCSTLNSSTTRLENQIFDPLLIVKVFKLGIMTYIETCLSYTSSMTSYLCCVQNRIGHNKTIFWEETSWFSSTIFRQTCLFKYITFFLKKKIVRLFVLQKTGYPKFTGQKSKHLKWIFFIH